MGQRRPSAPDVDDRNQRPPADTWSGATLLFGNMYNALRYGNASSWVWWTLAETPATRNSAWWWITSPPRATPSRGTSYRAIQPGAVRIEATSPDDLLALAFENPDGSIALVMYNKGKARLVTCPSTLSVSLAWFSHEGLFSRPAQAVPRWGSPPLPMRC